MPHLTQTLGVLLEYRPERCYERSLTAAMGATRQLVEAMPSCDLFRVNFHPSFTNWLPFYWAGYTQTTRYTYTIEDLTNLDYVFECFSRNIGRIIRKAQTSGFTVEETDDLGILLALNRRTFGCQGLAVPYPDELVRRIDTACKERDARSLLVVRDARGRVHMAELDVHDGGTTHALIRGSDPAARASEAGSLLGWGSIQLASRVSTRYDFTGSMIEGVERHMRSFGAIQTPYFSIFRDNRAPVYRAISAALRELRPLAGKGRVPPSDTSESVGALDQD